MTLAGPPVEHATRRRAHRPPRASSRAPPGSRGCAGPRSAAALHARRRLGEDRRRHRSDRAGRRTGCGYDAVQPRARSSGSSCRPSANSGSQISQGTPAASSVANQAVAVALARTRLEQLRRAPRRASRARARVAKRASAASAGSPIARAEPRPSAPRWRRPGTASRRASRRAGPVAQKPSCVASMRGRSKPLPSGRATRIRGVEQLRVDDRGVAELALARALAVIERLQDRDRREEAVAGVAQAAEAPQRLAAARHAAVFVLHAGQAAARLVVAGQLGARPRSRSRACGSRRVAD